MDVFPAGLAVNVTSNAGHLVRQILTGEVWPPLGDRHVYRTGPDGQAFALPGMGGMTLGVHCGDPATGYASDHLEPGASVRHRDPGANMALPSIIFIRDRERYRAEFPHLPIDRVRFHTIGLYLLSGGVSMRSLAPGTLFRPALALERLMAPAGSLLASMMTVELVKR